jgi:hypothetical protein
MAKRVVIHVAGNANLVQVVLALDTIRRCTHALHGRKQQSDKNSNDGNDDE